MYMHLFGRITVFINSFGDKVIRKRIISAEISDVNLKARTFEMFSLIVVVIYTGFKF